ncbi:MAG TPA: aspartate carbamoyltransferase catalytic subunit [Candidatus Ratteibacteria bacterium]|jgi:aspartate carbamoyltransferase catalytic subunit|uniref:Aspartate carbamoyltransferase n=1 Tax=candidate division TA06 bacterium ADurb.Bin131 TaxID=1852827 RepID=A0A1V6CCT2_UNCT6|nr:MAG: Aspartate carbamoyltransferase [candidate division TA06 bacterium ADurb.Bin131]HON05194.1 aspartate carbamoyltransferase catalytic subunit [bacterium]HRS06989.1 aspartate carbamoyltransferase catalytic subunit [Candidatus Ratteibacteria bacterium]HOQ81682.1 aspartate carbamoyltransferase catalytic subunit [bacterium]HPC29752.1 aspartate carbamoyltransferase catalytic subunit [bacterium]
MKWNKKDLLGLEDLSREEIEIILETARSFKEVSARPVKKVPALRGKTVVNLFFEPSTRTKTSFELAAKRLSADVLNFEVGTSSISKGETIVDTARNIEAMKVDCFIVRHSVSGAPLVISKNVAAAVINAGDGCHEHPTQALLDLFTIKEAFGKISGLKVTIIGDIYHSRVARSNIWGLGKLGAKIVVCGPPTLIPNNIEKIGVSVCYSLPEALKDADIVYLLRIQKERQQENFFPSQAEYRKFFGFDSKRINCTKKKFFLMHPGPINRGLEISTEMAEKENSLILQQVTNGIAVRMAVLYLTVRQIQ